MDESIENTTPEGNIEEPGAIKPINEPAAAPVTAEEPPAAPVTAEEPPAAPVTAEEPPAAPVRANEPPAVAGRSSASTVIDYTLRFTGAPSIGQLVAVAVASAVYIVLSWLAIITMPSGVPVVSLIFLAIGFGIPFAIWFGGWGFVIAYLGNFIGAGLLAAPPLPLPVALWFGTVDLIQLGLPMILYRTLGKRFGVNGIGKDVYTLKGFIFFVLCAVLPGNIIGGLYGNFILVQSGIEPASVFALGWFTWVLSNVVITLIIGSVLLRFLGPVVERFGLTVRNLFS